MFYQDAAHEAYRRLLSEQRYNPPEPVEETDKRRAKERINATIRRRLPRVA